MQSASPNDEDARMAASLSMQQQLSDNPNDQVLIKKQVNKENNDKDTNAIQKDYDKWQYYTLWFLFFLLGTFNNFGYVVILSAAKSLADCFNQSGLIGVESWALIGCGFIIKSINAFYFEGISHRIRGHICGIMFLTGYSLLSLSVYVDFWFAIFAILFIGTACSFGESVILGYCKLFPAEMSGAWSSGTGMAGLGGAGLYLLLAEVLKFTNQETFMVMIPSALIYMLAIEFTWKSSLRQAWNNNNNNKNKNDALVINNRGIDIDSDESDAPLLNEENQQNNNIDVIGIDIDIDMNNNDEQKESQWQQIKRCFMISWYRNSMLLLVYVFEYVISVGYAQIANTNRSQNRQDFDYVILATCYQFGVFLSRSSVQIIELPYFGFMTILQGLNVVLWAIHVETNFFKYEGVEFILMIYVGLLGGAMYVNCAYSLLKDKNIADKDKELCMNLMALAVNLGITFSSIVELVMDNVFYDDLVKKSDSGGSSSTGCNTL